MNNGNYNGAEPSKEAQLAPVAKSESTDSIDQGKNDESAGKVTFSKGDAMKNGESIVEIGTPEVVFSGMGKEELTKYANDPFWVRLRWSLFILFWLTWFGMLAAAIVIVVVAPKCSPPPSLTDFQKKAVYEVFSHSFQDGGKEQDGFGDFQGIQNRLDHFTYLGVDKVLLAPIFKSDAPSPNSFSYGASNFFDVDPTLGTLSDFDNLVAAAKKKNVKILLDLVPNHSSDKHEWFLKSVKSEGNYSNYYVWSQNGTEGKVPDSQANAFGDSAWTFESERQEWYRHQLGAHQPDLNYDDSNVRQELMNLVRFWLDRDVAGFRIKNADYIFVQEGQKLYGLLEEIRQILKSYEEIDGFERTLMTDASGVPSASATVNYYGNETSNLTVIPFNFDFIGEIATNFNGLTLNKTISNYLSSVPTWGWPVWVSGSEDKSRLASRIGVSMIDAVAMIQILLPGTPSIYYGEEIGMEDLASLKTNGSCQTSDANCDVSRTPMQWNSEPNAGFSSANETWLPVGTQVTVEKGRNSAGHLKVYKKLLALRKEKSLMHGVTGFPLVDEDIFSFTRIRKGAPGYLIIVNGGNSTREVDLSKSDSLWNNASEEELIKIPSEAKVAVLSADSKSTYTEG